MYGAQEDAFFNDARYSITEASAKSGKTVGAEAWLFEQAFVEGGPGRHYWWVAPIREQAKIAFRRMKRGLTPGIAEPNESELTLTLVNGSVIAFKGSDKPDSLYGEDVYAAVMDEATRCKEEAWHALRSTLSATEGPIRIIGNVKGRKNWAYRLARRAEAGEPNMSYHKITAYEAAGAGVLSREEIEDARRTLPEAVFQELYLAEPSDDHGNPFGVEAIRACIGPLSDDDPVAWGWDLAKSVDYTAGYALGSDGAICREEHFQAPWQETIEAIRSKTSQAPAYVDSTGVGDPVLEALQRGGGSNFEGYKFTSSSKQQLMEGLAVALQHQEIVIPDGGLVAELEAFEYEYRRNGVSYSAPEGMHDDRVCALALAVARRNNRRVGWELF